MAEYSYANPRYKALAQSLIDADPELLNHIDVSTIAFLNKEEKNPKWPFRIIALREPYIMLTNKCYIIEVSELLDGDLSQPHRELHMYKILRQVDRETGRIIHPDVIEFSDIIDLFGYKWQDDKNLDSIIDKLEARRIANLLVSDDEIEDEQEVI